LKLFETVVSRNSPRYSVDEYLVSEGFFEVFKKLVNMVKYICSYNDFNGSQTNRIKEKTLLVEGSCAKMTQNKIHLREI